MKELLKKFLQKLTRENLSNTCQLGWKAFKWVMQVTEGYHWLITFSIFSGIFGVVMSLVNVAMSKWIIDVATGTQEGNIYLVATIVALSFLLLCFSPILSFVPLRCPVFFTPVAGSFH